MYMDNGPYYILFTKYALLIQQRCTH